ncbi:MAG: ATP-binding cassette domain-containing protein [Planctomyces sp.]
MMTDRQMPVISARHLNFSFGEGELQKQVLFDVCLDVAPGEIVLLTGPSGSGKTTLLTLIGALRTVRDGELTVLSRPLHHTEAAELVLVRREIGFIFQQHNLLPFMTARQNVELMFYLHPEISRADAHQRTIDLLTSVGLADRMDYFPARMSGGQKQRVAIARALASQPKLILADEPTAALDSQSGRDVVTLLQELARDRNCPILMVTHDPRILDIADRIINMEDGRIHSVKD